MESSDKSNTAELRRSESIEADYCTGTKEQLIAARICEVRWFPKKLEPEFCKDGQAPRPETTARQRHRRTYRVEGRQPETILTVRFDASGTELWTVQIAVDDKERGRA